MGDTIKGPWNELTHLEKHQNMSNNLIILLADLDDAMNPELNYGATLPRTPEGNIEWGKISVEFLLQWTVLNAAKVGHKHVEGK